MVSCCGKNEYLVRSVRVNVALLEERLANAIYCCSFLLVSLVVMTLFYSIRGIPLHPTYFAFIQRHNEVRYVDHAHSNRILVLVDSIRRRSHSLGS
jgi:hypothetical protein